MAESLHFPKTITKLVRISATHPFGQLTRRQASKGLCNAATNKFTTVVAEIRKTNFICHESVVFVDSRDNRGLDKLFRHVKGSTALNLATGRLQQFAQPPSEEMQSLAKDPCNSFHEFQR